MITPELKKLNREQIYRFLGLQDQDAFHRPALGSEKASVDPQIDRCEEAVLKASHPRCVYKIVPVSSVFPAADSSGSSGDENVRSVMSECSPLITFPGNDIRRLLDGCSEAVFMALTLGSELEHVLMRSEVTNMSDAFVLDVCASAAVEAAADDFEEKLRSQLAREDRYLTNRFSPGYGDLPLSVQRPLLDLLNAQRAIGLTLTPTDLMVPRKSMTAVMGICDSPKGSVLGDCSHCPLRTKCSWRAHGLRCYYT